MLKKASAMTVDELRAEVEKIEAQRAKRRAYSKLHRKAMTPELKAKLAEYNKRKREHQREVLQRAAEEGIGNVCAPDDPTTQAAPPQKPKAAKPAKRRR